MTTQADALRMADAHDHEAHIARFHASGISKLHADTAAMLREYAAILNVDMEMILKARRAYAGRENIDTEDYAPNNWMRAALTAALSGREEGK